MPLPTGLTTRNGVWQLRIGVPIDLAHLYPGPNAYRESLKTRDRAEAITKAYAVHAQYRQTFDRQRATARPRTTPATPKLTAALIDWLQHSVLTDDDGNAPAGQRLALVPLEPGDLLATELSTDPYDRAEQIAQALQDYADALALLFSMGDFGSAQDFAVMTAKQMGIPPIDWTEAPAELPKFARALVKVYQALADRAQGAQIETPPAPSPLTAPGVPAASPGHSLADVFKEWKAGKKLDAINKTTRALAKLEAAGVTAPLRDLTRQHGLAFRDHINKTMPEASGKTRSDVLASIQALLNFAVKEKGWLDTNPWAGTAISKGRAKKREAWDQAALATLLTAPLAEDRRLNKVAQYWIPLLALMTGARQAELCQLRVSDVYERDGVWLLDINEVDEGKSTKSAAGDRKVAVHSKLIELGLLDHLRRMQEAGESLVFPGVLASASRTASVNVSDWFRERCVSLGIYRRYRDFHALRTTVGTALRAVEPPLGEANITAVMGHEAGNVGAANYNDPAPKTLQRVIESLDFPAVMALQRIV